LNKKDKIILIGQLPPIITGQSLVTSDTYNILIKRGADIIVHNLHYTEQKGFRKILLVVKTFFSISLDIIINKSVVYISAARSRFGFFRNAYIIILSSLFHRKIIVHFHCGDYNEFLETNGAVFRKIVKYIFTKVDVSIILGKSLVKNFDSIYNNKMQVAIVPNGVTIKKQSNKNSQILNVLFMSNLIESKGYLDLLEAINILVNKYKIDKIRVDICGRFINHEDNLTFSNIDQYISNFNDFIITHKLSDYIKYHDLVSGEIKDSLFQNSDLFVLPTYYSTEAQPLSILEALSYGKVVLATNHRGIPDMVIDNYNGLIIEKKSPISIVEAILRLIDDKQFRSTLSINARKHVIDNFSLVKYENNIIELFAKFNTL
jgi:glycosyltransferase involved in cell wall biosynthesis